MNDIDSIKQKIDIVDFIGEYLTLKKAGRNFKANCPFHNEKSPSFMVSPERQIWHCFGCQKGGDVFKFLMEYEKIEFSESLRFFAQKTGVKLVGDVFTSETASKRDLIYAINHISASFYNYLLLEHNVGKNALSYLLEKRKLSVPLIKTFNLGFAPGSGYSLVDYLTNKKNYKPEDLLASGVATSRNGRLFDFFRNRIIFPIYDNRENIIAFAGRALSDAPSNGPKYINTKETLVYKKGSTLFGLHLAKEEIKKEKKVIVVEGEFDMISSFKEGIKNIVAVKGTSLTEEQISVLKRYAEKVSFCFDTDKAGEDAQKRSIMLIEKANISASVIIPPLGKDPDELLNENPALFKKAVKKDVNIYDYIIESAGNEVDIKTAEGKKSFLEKTLPYLVLIENEVIKEFFYKKLAMVLETSLESIVRQAEKLGKNRQEKQNPEIKKYNLREELIEPYLLALIIQAKDPKETFLLSKQIIKEEGLSTPVYNKIYNHINEFLKTDNEFSINNFTKTMPSELEDAFNKCYLLPLPQLEEEKYLPETEKIAKETRSLSLKNKLKKIGEDMKLKEKSENGKDLKNLEEEFNKLTLLLKE